EAVERLRVGGPRIRAIAQACGGDEAVITGKMVTELAAAGDPDARDVVRQIGHALGRGLANVVVALDPGTVVIGGGVSKVGALLLDPTREALSSHLSGRGHRPLPRLETAMLGPEAGMIGAADLARVHQSRPQAVSRR
ncbi:MAG: ROK family protein, partial [Ornithinimicrobium sp.]